MDILNLSFDIDNGFTLTTHWLVIVISFFVIILFLSYKIFYSKNRYSEFEIDEATIGIGSHKIKIKPNDQDIQIAYQLWVELSTRKIGLPIDTENDVITELYNSWYEFFKIARELIKAVPVRKVRANTSTKELIGITFKILNDALRPHLTRWQARFRSWHEIEKENNKNLTPQELQQAYPEFTLLIEDMVKVNKTLISYKELLESLVNVR